MKTEKAYIIGTHPYSFRSGEPAEIIGVKLVTPSSDIKCRLCYEIEFSDGFKDSIAVEDASNYTIVQFSDLVDEHLGESLAEEKTQMYA